MERKIILTAILALSVCFLPSFIPYHETGEEHGEHLSSQNAPWEIDMDHSSIGFMIKHLGIAKIHGFFRNFDGRIMSDQDDLVNGSIDFTIDVNSLDSFNDPRDTHLKSKDFFNVKEYPEIAFTSKSFKRAKGGKYRLTGDLTIKDITKEVTFEVIKTGEVTVAGIRKAAYEATATINRFDFNLNWNALTPEQVPIVDQHVTIMLFMEIFRGA